MLDERAEAMQAEGNTGNSRSRKSVRCQQPVIMVIEVLTKKREEENISI